MLNLKNFLIEIFFPSQCLGCGQDGLWLCPDCRKSKDLTFFENHFSSQEFKFLDGAWSAFNYHQNRLIQKLISRYKYSLVKELDQPLSQILLNFFNFLKIKDKLEIDLILPIPLARKKQLWRGFNQTELLANGLASGLGLGPLDHQIIKRANASAQVGQAAQDRQQNILGLFTVTDSELIKNKNILLIDDVLTTGSTLEECAKILKQAGAKMVYGLTLAKS